MTAIVIVGAQWGDEGKGKIVDLCAERADMVVRFAGGPNAGHTLVVGDKKMVVRLIPSGILHATTLCVLGQGMVIDPAVLVSEIDAVEAKGHATAGRLFVSDRAHLILPYHPEIDALREAAADEGRKIGTTKRGIGPCYEDKAGRRGIRALDLRDFGRLEGLLEAAIAAWTPFFNAVGKDAPAIADILGALAPLAERIVPLLADTSTLVNDAIRQKKRVVLEGAQATLLDLDHGTYPYVTSSSAVAGGACIGAGIGPTRVHRVIGVAKGYCTRVGEGPFPTELTDETGERLRVRGGEFGSVTGRPRRTGWIDLPAIRYAARVNGLDALAITKLDVLTGLSKVRACVAYDTPSGRTPELPIDALAQAKPVYEDLPGWSDEITNARREEDLPEAVRRYIRFIEEGSGVPVDMISISPSRADTIVRRDAFA